MTEREHDPVLIARATEGLRANGYVFDSLRDRVLVSTAVLDAVADDLRAEGARAERERVVAEVEKLADTYQRRGDEVRRLDAYVSWAARQKELRALVARLRGGEGRG